MALGGDVAWTAIDIRRSELEAAGALASFGAPLHGERWCVDGVGRVQEFEHGVLLWSPTWGAWAMSEPVASAYRALDESSRLDLLGYPTSDPATAEGDPGIPMAEFECGRLYVRPGGSVVLAGAVYQRWRESLRDGHATLGHPVSAGFGPVRGAVARSVATDGTPVGIYAADGTTAVVLTGAIETWYTTTDQEFLATVGVPVSDVRPTADGMGTEAEFELALVTDRGGEVRVGPRPVRPGPAASTPANGGFETGDLEGWTSIPDGAIDPFVGQPVLATSISTRDVRIGPQGPIGRLGGDYWHMPFPTGGTGSYVLALPPRENSPTGVLRSAPFVVDHRFLIVKLGGLLGAGWVTLRTTPEFAARLLAEPVDAPPDADGLVPVWTVTSPGHVQMHQFDFEVSALSGAPVVVEVVRRFDLASEGQDAGWLLVDDIALVDQVPPYAAPVLGWADIHSHPTSQAAFGGLLVGRNHGPVEDLEDCAEVHGHQHSPLPMVTLAGALDAGRSTSGAPDFDGWPAFDSLTHQQMHEEWIRRAYLGGQRLLVALVVHNPVLDTLARLPFDVRRPQADSDTIEPQIAMLHHFANHNSDWCGIALSPDGARELILADKLAVVIGLETDSINGWIRDGDLDGPEDDVRQRVHEYLNYLADLGVRQINPVHLADSGVGGHAVYADLFLMSSWWQRGVSVKLADGWFDPEGRPHPAHAQVLYQAFSSGRGAPPKAVMESLAGTFFKTVLDAVQADPTAPLADHPVLEPLRVDYSDVGPADLPPEATRHGHVNAAGLTRNGHVVFQELAKLGFVIDLDHMSERTVHDVSHILEMQGRPFVAAHSAMRELCRRPDDPRFDPADGNPPGVVLRRDYGSANHEGWPSETGKARWQMDLLRGSGGLAGPITHAAAGSRTYRGPRGSVPNDCFGSSKSWAQQYLSFLEQMNGVPTALGTDINCLCEQLAPRFGPMAGWGLRDDPEAERAEAGFLEEVTLEPPALALRRLQVCAQSQGVRYDSPPEYFGPNRYRGHGASDPSEDVAWLAIAMARLGVPDQAHLFRAGTGDAWGTTAARALAVVEGMSGAPEADVGTRGSDARAGAMLGGRVAPEPDEVAPLLDLLRRADGLWDEATGVRSEHPPLVRYRTRAGGREWDVNLDGLAHYGLFPDALQDLTNVGFPDSAMAALFSSAERYLQVWQRSTPARN